jgi:hypothetical protein
LLAWVGTTTFQQVQVQTNDPYLKNAPMHMFAAAAPTGPASGVTNLTMAEVDALLPTAIARLASTLSLNAAAIAELEAAHFQIADLPDDGLGATSGDTITLSPDAAGWGWFIDPRPQTDSAFTVATANGLGAAPGSAASNEMDLLTVEMHELEHVLGYGDISSGLMSEYLTAGTRLAPPASGATTASLKTAGSPALAAFALAAPAGVPVVVNGGAGTPGNASAIVLGGFAPAPSAGGYPGNLIQSNIVVAPTVFGLSAARAVPSDSFIQLDDYFGWSGEFANGQSTTPPSAQVGDAATAWLNPPSTPAPTSHAADPARIAWGSAPTAAVDSSDNDGGAAGPEWLDDFLVHLGQDDTLRNPNAGMRVRPNGGGSAA